MTEPLTPPECDLRDFPFMPLDVVRLRDSEMAAVGDAEVFRAAVLCWCVSWHQVPAGSLPDDDPAIARLIGMGRAVRAWQKLRAAGALRGYVKCSDGRLYHDVVSEKACKSWEAKNAQRDRTQKAREARLSQRQSQTGDGSVTDTVTTTVTASKVSKGKVSEGKGNARASDRRAAAAWNGSAAPLVAQVGPDKFNAWFADSVLDLGPPVKIIFPKPFQAKWVRDNLSKELERAFGELPDLEAAA